MEHRVMTIMLGKVYSALKAAGAPEDEAIAAAEEMGAMRDELGAFRSVIEDMKAELSALRVAFNELRAEVHSDFAALRAELHGDVAGLRSEIAYLRGRFDVLIWAVGINAAATIAILGVLLRH
jgi:hypothetical protein